MCVVVDGGTQERNHHIVVVVGGTRSSEKETKEKMLRVETVSLRFAPSHAISELLSTSSSSQNYRLYNVAYYKEPVSTPSDRVSDLPNHTTADERITAKSLQHQQHFETSEETGTQAHPLVRRRLECRERVRGREPCR